MDEPAAEVVKRIYRLCCQGVGINDIAATLQKDRILIPSAYTAKYFPGELQAQALKDPYHWNATTIGYILDRQEYLGHTGAGQISQ